MFEYDYEYNCKVLLDEINNKTYEIGYSICFVVTHPKPREVFAANFRDRVVHHLLMAELEPLFERVFIKNTFNCRKGKGTLYGLKTLREEMIECSDYFNIESFVAKFDLSNFFMSIDKEILWNKLQKFINDNYLGKNKDLILYLTHKVVMHCPENKCIKKVKKSLWDKLGKGKSLFTTSYIKGLPIGNLTSQIFANFYLSDLDNFLSSEFKFYGRYVDDFYILSRNKQELINIIPKIIGILNDLQIKLNPRKISIQDIRKGCSFIGGTIKQNRFYTGNRTRINCIKCIHRYRFLSIRDKNYLKTNLYSIRASLNSYFGHFKHFQSRYIKYNILRQINWCNQLLITKDLNKFIIVK